MKALNLGTNCDHVKRILEPPHEYVCKVCGDLMAYLRIDRRGESLDQKCKNQVVDDDVPNYMLRELIFEYPKYFIGEFAGFRKFEMTPIVVLKCPLSTKLTDRPMVVSFREPFEELSIRNWFKAGNTHCPRSTLPRIIKHLSCSTTLRILSSACFAFPKGVLNNHPTLKELFMKALELSEFEDTRTRAIETLDFLSSEMDPRLGSDEIASNRALLCLFQAIIKDEDIIHRESYMTVLMRAFRERSRTMDHKCLGEFAIGNKLDALGILTGISRNRDDVNAPLAIELICEMRDAEEWVKLLHNLEILEKWTN
ncbi:hypothetical protein OROHE_010279 [Orobanche hederae]